MKTRVWNKVLKKRVAEMVSSWSPTEQTRILSVLQDVKRQGKERQHAANLKALAAKKTKKKKIRSSSARG